MFSQLVLSSADSLSGFLQEGSSPIVFGPVGLASGAAPPAFHQTKTIAAFAHTYDNGPTVAGLTGENHATLQVNATNLVSTASSSGLGVDSIGTQATADIASASAVLTGNPLSTLSLLGLSASATLIHSDSDASYVFGPDRGSLTGEASFGSLTISGALIGKTLTFAGQAVANTVLYHSSTVTITLDRQVLSDFLPPSAGAAVQPNRITTDAVSIFLHDAPVFGKTISGSITLGETSASLFPPLHA
jgi:hypothetical protein